MNNALQTTRSVVDPQNPDAVVEAVVSAVADAEGTSPLELQPLANVIDTDALCALCRRGNAPVTLAFRYHGYAIRVSSDDHVTVEVGSD